MAKRKTQVVDVGSISSDQDEMVVNTGTADPIIVEPEESPKPAEMPAPLRQPTNEAKLSPEQRRIRELEDQLAREQGRNEPLVEYETPSKPDDGENIIIHFLEDGFTALGQVWFRGQEIEFEPGSRAHRDTFDTRGRSWLDLRNDEFAQVEKWGKVMFRTGPWPGKSYTDALKSTRFEPLKAVGGKDHVSPPSEEELRAAELAEKKRRRAAPVLPIR